MEDIFSIDLNCYILLKLWNIAFFQYLFNNILQLYKYVLSFVESQATSRKSIAKSHINRFSFITILKHHP